MSAVPQILGVVGAGTMGAGIAQVALEAGWQVRLHDPFTGAVERGRERIADGLRRRAAKRDLVGHDVTQWVDDHLARLTTAPDLTTLVTDIDLVIEAIVEDLAPKRELFGALDAAASPGTILATNTSALSVTAIAEGARTHPERLDRERPIHPVDDEPGAVGGPDRRLAPAGHDSGRSLEDGRVRPRGGDDFDEQHDRRRVEEVETEDALRVRPSALGDGRNGQCARVRREDRVWGRGGIELGEQVSLGLKVLDDGLDHEVGT